MKFVHENNILNKIELDYKGLKNKLKSFHKNEYSEMRRKLSEISFNSLKPTEFEKASKIIDSYLEKVNHQVREHGITSQSKFRSTFIEEISTYLFKEIPEIKNKTFGVYNSGVYAGIKIKNNGTIDVLKKDVDVCIGKEVKIKIDNGPIQSLIVPIIAVEVKTFLDATMFGEVQFSSKMIKNATPQVKTYVLMEYNAVGKDKILAARQDNILNEMFALRKDATSEIDSTVLMDYFKEVLTSIKCIKKEEEIITPGRLLNFNLGIGL